MIPCILKQCNFVPLWLQVLIYLIVHDNYLGFSTAQVVRVTQRLSSVNNIDPVVHVSCSFDLPEGSYNHVIQWVFENQLVSNNAKLFEAESPRYSLSDNGYSLSIRNALKADEGMYTCQLSYGFRSTTNYRSGSSFVHIISYLPAVNYPECSIEPNNHVVEGNPLTFICVSGVSTANINLQLEITRPDGSSTDLGPTNKTKVVTTEDDFSFFDCIMTSDTFPTARRTCTAGPIRVFPITTSVPLENDAVKTPSLITNKLITPLIPQITHPLETQQYNTPLIIGCVVASILVVLLLIIMVLFLRYHKCHSPNISTEHTNNIDSKTKQETSIGDPYYEQIVDTDTKLARCTPDQEQVYASVNETDKVEEGRSSKSTAVDNMPWYHEYAKVNTSYGNDSNNDESNEDSSGFVDNSLYVPSGPY